MNNLKNLCENPNLEQTYYSRTSTSKYKIGHDSTRLLKKLAYYDRSHHENSNNYDLMASTLSYSKKILNGQSYVEVKDHLDKIHPSKNISLRLREEPKFLGTQNQLQNETQKGKKEKVIKNDKDELVVKVILKRDKQNLNHQIVLVVYEIID